LKSASIQEVMNNPEALAKQGKSFGGGVRVASSRICADTRFTEEFFGAIR
jgi:hypothetical protein